jgi:hypothetical protein
MSPDGVPSVWDFLWANLWIGALLLAAIAPAVVGALTTAMQRRVERRTRRLLASAGIDLGTSPEACAHRDEPVKHGSSFS